jgi:hypothetical protein
MPFIYRSAATIWGTLIVSLILFYFGTYGVTRLGHANSSVVAHGTGALDGATSSITGNQYSGSGSYILKDNGPDGINNSTGGTSTIGGLKAGNYTITQITAPNGFSKDKLSRIVQISANQTNGAIFTNPALKEVQNNRTSQLGAISYSAKFECGSIAGQEGPLRPGHYDTDISIFNRQDYPVRILWKALSNNGENTNKVPRDLQPQTSFSIICKDIRQSLNLGNNSKELVEGFVLIRIDLSRDLVNSLLPNIGSLDRQTSLSPDPMNLLDVQVFYTANALESLPHEVIVSKITFSILDNATLPKIPIQLLGKSLDVTIVSQMNEISDPDSNVKKILSEKYHLSAPEVNELQIRIINVDIGITSTIDDHAISSSTLRPQLSA